MSQIRKIILTKQKEALFPPEQASDVERLEAVTKGRSRKLKHFQPATQPTSPVQSCSPSLSPTPTSPRSPARAKTRPTSLLIQPKRVKQVYTRSLVVDLPLLPFSQHCSYNQEKDFVRTHFRELREDGKESELEEALLARNKRLDTKMTVSDRKKQRLKDCRSS